MATPKIKYTATHRGITDTRTSHRVYTHTFWLHFDRRIQKASAIASYKYDRKANRKWFEECATGSVELWPGQHYPRTAEEIEQAKAWLARDEAADIAAIEARYDTVIAAEGETYWKASGQFASRYDLALSAARAAMAAHSAAIGYEIVEVTKA